MANTIFGHFVVGEMMIAGLFHSLNHTQCARPSDAEIETKEHRLQFQRDLQGISLEKKPHTYK